jgi:hypothetical protein
MCGTEGGGCMHGRGRGSRLTHFILQHDRLSYRKLLSRGGVLAFAATCAATTPCMTRGERAGDGQSVTSCRAGNPEKSISHIKSLS